MSPREVWPYRSRRRLREELEEELRDHLERRTAELEAQGYSTAEARAEALRRFGDVERTRSVCLAADLRRTGRAVRREWLGEVRTDLRLGLRQLRQRPRFAAAAITTLALGIGAVTGMVAVADHVLLRPLPFAHVDEVVTLWEHDLEAGAELEVSPGNFLDWQERITSFREFALAEPSSLDLTGAGDPEALPGWAVSEGWFEALGVRPVLGRLFSAEEYRDGGAVVLSHALWQRRFGGDAGVVGRALTMDARPTLVVGVLPAGLQYPADGAQVWLPRAWREADRADRRASYMRAIGRLRPGTTVPQAQAELAAIARWQAAHYPVTNAMRQVVVRPLAEQVLGSVRPALLALLGAVGLVLLIACANVAGLLVARGAERERELAVRVALGGSRGRLLRQLLTESLLLALLAGAAGVLLAALLVRVLPQLAPADLPRLGNVRVDARIVVAASALSTLCALLFGMAPALRAARLDPAVPLRRARASAPGQRLRRVLVAGELAFALVLLAGAGLLGRSFARLLDSELGFETTGRASLQVFAWDHWESSAERTLFVQRVLERMRALPEVRAAAAVSALPLHPHRITAAGVFRRDGEPEPTPGREQRVYTTVATPGYFGAAGIRLLRGRDFVPADDERAPRVAIINETLARRHFGEEDPIGRRVVIGAMGAPAIREVVGVVADVRPGSLDSPFVPELYVPHAQHGTGSMTFLVHTRGAPGPVLPALRRAVWAEQPAQTIYHEATLAQLLATTLAERRFHLLLLGAFAALALLLAGVGLYALISFATELRRAEIGVRMALGAPRLLVARMIVLEGLVVALPGIALGLAGALAVSRGLQGVLYGVSAADPLALLALALTLLAVTLLATLLPALRAMRLDPARALRAD